MTDHHGNTLASDNHDNDPGLLPPMSDKNRLPTPQQKESATDAPPQQRESAIDAPPQQRERESAIDAPVVRESLDGPERLPGTPRWSTCNRKPVDRFKFDKAHGYGLVKHFSLALCKCLSTYQNVRHVYDVNYSVALALDSEFGILDNVMTLSPDIFIRNPFMFKAKSKCDPGTPNIRDAMTGHYREALLEGMSNKINELIALHVQSQVQKQS